MSLTSTFGKPRDRKITDNELEYQTAEGYRVMPVAPVNPYSETKAAAIADGATESAAIELLGGIPTHLHIPSGFEGTAITFKASPNGTDYYTVYEHDDTDASALPMTVAHSRTYELPKALWGLRYLKIVAGTAQTGAVTLYVDVN
jgi:hypothetical protein